MRSVRLTFTDPPPLDPVFPSIYAPMVVAENDGDAPIRFKFFYIGGDSRALEIQPGERATIAGARIYNARIEALDYPRKGLVRFSR